MLLPSPEATEELPMNPFQTVRHPLRHPQHFQQDRFLEGDPCVPILPQLSCISRATAPPYYIQNDLGLFQSGCTASKSLSLGLPYCDSDCNSSC